MAAGCKGTGLLIQCSRLFMCNNWCICHIVATSLVEASSESDNYPNTRLMECIPTCMIAQIIRYGRISGKRYML